MIFNPQKESGYPDNCITLEDAIAGIRKVFKSPDSFRVEKFKIECVTNEGNFLNLSFDRQKVKP